MKIFGYCMTMPDEIDVLPDALDSLAAFCDRVYVVDGGFSATTLCKHPRYTEPLGNFLLNLSRNGDTHIRAYEPYCLYGDLNIKFHWNGVECILWEHEFTTPGGQRNWILENMLQEPEQPDWIVWVDSDEVCSNEFIRDIRPFLAELSPDVSNICPRWFTLIEDEQHYVPEYSNFLSHSRIHHPGIVNWSNEWHENQSYVGRRVEWDSYIIHTRMLFRKRLYVQREHCVINEGAWSSVTSRTVPEGVTWKLHWPEGEPRGIPYNEDIREYI